MSSASPALATTARLEIDLEGLLAQYEATRYLDAYRATERFWRDPAVVEQLGAPELIHGGRLAGRLGNDKVRRWLFRRALDLAPEEPVVRYYARYARRLDPPLALVLRDFEEAPELEGADPALAASWAATHAHFYAIFREFDRAHALVRRARDSGAERAWVSYCEAEVLLAEDRWDEALAAAEEGWRRSPGMPALASVLGRALAKRGRLREAADRLLAAAASVQSYETLGTGLWYLCAVAEQTDGEERRQLAERAHQLARGLDALAPLADRHVRSYIARARTDAAMILGDHELLAREAAGVREPFFQRVVENLERHPHGERLLLPIRRVYQKHLTCFPASVAAAASALGEHIDENALSEALTYDGTAAWRILDWLGEHGYETRAFILTPALARALLREGIPFIYLTEGLTSSHATVVMGVDEACGTLLIHDPSASRWDQVLVDRVEEGEAPFGPEAIAVVPRARAALLDVIPEAQSAPYSAYIAHRRLLERQGAGAARAAVEELEKTHPGHPFTERLRALQDGLEGNVHAAIATQQRLLDAYPQSVPLRRELLQSLRQTGNSAEIRRRLGDIVERGQLPGIRTRETWRSPPATYLAQYADYLGTSAEHVDGAERLLWKAARQDPYLAEAYHILGDVLARAGRHHESLFHFRLAASLATENEHYARAHADALRDTGRDGDAVAVLEARVRRLGARVEGQHAWLTWIDTLEDYGRPEEAMRAMREAQALRPEDPDLSSYAAKFWVRMGEWGEAQAALATVERSGHRGLYLEAAVSVLRSAGRWEEALPLAEAWVAEVPERLEARRSYLRLYAMAHGRRAATALSERWSHERAGHDDLEQVHYEQLRLVFDDEGAERLLRARLARNPSDAWAWRELGHALVDRAQRQQGREGDGALVEVEHVRQQVLRLAPEAAATLVLDARVEQLSGRPARAIEGLVQALALDPGFSYCYARAWEWSEALTPDAQRRCLEQLERRLLRSVGFAHDARALAFDVARRFGVKDAVEAVGRWRAARPDDPEVIEAAADLWLELGQGVSDAERAAELLAPAVRRFPAHLDLALSLAQAHGVLLREDEQIAVLRDILRRQPIHATARRALARVLAHRGEVDGAVRVLEEGTTLDPLDQEVWGHLASLQWDFGRHADAVATLERAVARVPEGIGNREVLIDRLLETGRPERAVEIARSGVELFPDGAYAWHLLAQTLERSELGVGVVEVESAYRKALALNGELYDAASGLAVLLARQRRHGEAREVLERIVPVLTDPSPAHVRLAWLTREAGNREGARGELLAVLDKWPFNRWAWSLWMDWVEDDSAWEEARTRLASVDGSVTDHPRLAARRLALLGQAGVDETTLDGGWQRLLADFPQDLELHLRRFDLLSGAGNWAAAAEVLRAVERFHPFSGYLLARKVAVLSREGDAAGAVATAVQVWQLPGDDEEWPEERAWKELASEGGQARPAEAAIDLVLAGKRIRRAAFELLVDNIDGARPPERRRGWGAYLPSRPVEVLRRILASLDAHGWDDGKCKAYALAELSRRGRRAALAYWRGHRDECRANTAVWQAVGSMLARSGRRFGPELRAWMADWREHAGVEMWAVANYTLSLRETGTVFHRVREELEELYRTSRDALERLAHDWVARYHAAVLCETALRLGREEELLARAEAYGDLLADTGGNHWTPPSYAWGPALVLALRDLVRASDAAQALAATRKVLALRVPASVRWLRHEWMRRLEGKLSRARRAWVYVALWWSRP